MMATEAQFRSDNYGFCVGQSSTFVNTQLEDQRRELDQVVIYQNGRLRLAVQEHRRQQMALILRNYNTKTVNILKQKDQELAEAFNRKLELENFLQRMEIECKKWQQMATEYESMAESLYNTIQQYKENTYFTNQVEDSESCCDVGGEENNVNSGKTTGGNICKCCGFRISRVILFPCRHICCCKLCEGLLSTCPVCRVVKKASIEALF